MYIKTNYFERKKKAWSEIAWMFRENLQQVSYVIMEDNNTLQRLLIAIKKMVVENQTSQNTSVN